jgi:hypothetical protein
VEGMTEVLEGERISSSRELSFSLQCSKINL